MSKRTYTHIYRALLLLLSFVCALAYAAEPSAPAWPGRIEVVQAADWNESTPPETGWIETTLPDDWSLRWPQFDGVVWYRLTWKVPAPSLDSGLFLDYLNMAGVVSVNGAVLAQDRSLIEPLTRSWNLPRFFRLPPPLIHAGENMLLVRVSGLAAYQPGLGTVQIGAPAAMQAAFESARWARLNVPLFYLAVGVTLGSFFLVLWLLHRRETAYGWYALLQFAWLVFEGNQLVTSMWPFPNTPLYKAAINTALLVFCASNVMFVLRFCERRWPRREAALWGLTALASLSLFLTHHLALRSAEELLLLYAMVMAIVTNALFLAFAWQPDGRIDQRILSIGAFIGLLAGCRDALVVMRVIGGNTFYATYAEQLSVIAVALVLAWNFVRNLRRIEGFNLELQRNVEEARGELATTLSRQHELELVQARLGERVNLAHDLHDGLGGMLIGNIAALEQAPDNMSSRKVLDMFRELRDDLRLIIDTASAQHYGEHSLAELLAPLRHRMTRLFEAHDIDVSWHLGDLGQTYLTTTQSLDLMRVLQEALANVLKHAGASRVQVELHNDAGALTLEVSDDGRGMQSTDTANFGTGMRSMRARARRLGATLTVGSEAGATIVRLHIPKPA